MSKPKRSTAQLEALKAEIERELAERQQVAATLSVTGLRQQLRAHRQMMRESGPILSLEDERTERNLIRAIELARAPAAAQHGAPDGLERVDGVSNAGLSGTTAADVNEEEE